MNCGNCGAALPAKSGLCGYCGTLNDIDLRGLFDAARRGADPARHCPRCRLQLDSLDLGLGRALRIERCEKCLGMFIDADELRLVVASKVDEAEQIDHARLAAILAEETPDDFSAVRYVKCPTCDALMNRRSYGARAGVIVDECREHGIWLDGGELRRILKWTRSGGTLHQSQRAAEAAQQEARDRRLTERIDTGKRESEEAVAAGVDVISLVVDLLRVVMRNT